MKQEEREELLAAYALGSLPSAEARVVEDLVRSDAAAAAELAGYHEIVDLIALSAPLRRADPLLRRRVVAAARRESSAIRGAWQVRRLLRWGFAAAVLALAFTWGANMQHDLELVRRENVRLTSVVEADAKRIEALSAAGGEIVQSAALRLELEAAIADQEIVLAVSADRDSVSSQPQATPAGHGAGGQYIWSDSAGAGVIVVRGLPPLPLAQGYQVWLENGTEAVAGGTFVPDQQGDMEVVVRPAGDITPARILIAAAPAGGSATVGNPIVLVGLVSR